MAEYSNRPTFGQLLARIRVDFADVPEHVRDGVTASWARAVDGVHDHIAWYARQSNPSTCDEELLPLWAWLYGVDRLEARAAEGLATATGNPGAIVLDDAVLRSLSRKDYRAREAATLDANGAATVRVVAEELGVASNLAAGSVIALIDPIAGVQTNFTVGAAGLSGGAERETMEAWRTRLTEEWREVTTNGARGGKEGDYVYWCRSARPDVTGAIVQRHVLGWGTVIVRPICDGLPNRLPTQAVLEACSDKLWATAPATADWRLALPVPKTVKVVLDLESAVDNTANRAQITADIQAIVDAEVGSGSKLLLAEIDGAVAKTTTNYTRVAPTANVEAGAIEVLVLESVEFV